MLCIRRTETVVTIPQYILHLRSRIGHDLLLCPAVAALIPDGQGRILIQEKSGGEGWSLPAGLIEPGETPEHALVREVGEETGLVVRPVRIIGAFGGSEFRHTYPNGDVVEHTIVLYLCEVLGATNAPLDPETKSLQYFDRAGVAALGLPFPIGALFADAGTT